MNIYRILRPVKLAFFRSYRRTCRCQCFILLCCIELSYNPSVDDVRKLIGTCLSKSVHEALRVLIGIDRNFNRVDDVTRIHADIHLHESNSRYLIAFKYRALHG